MTIMVAGLVLALLAALLCWLAWEYDARDRRRFEATLTENEQAELQGFRMVGWWRHFARLIHTERDQSSGKG